MNNCLDKDNREDIAAKESNDQVDFDFGDLRCVVENIFTWWQWREDTTNDKYVRVSYRSVSVKIKRKKQTAKFLRHISFRY